MIYHRNSMDDFSPNLDGLQDEVDKAVAYLTPIRDTFNGIVVRGMSGVIPGVPVSLALECTLVVVRKPDEDRHACEPLINGNKVEGGRWLFFDDFVSGGGTRQAVVAAITKAKGKVTAEWMTRDDLWRPLTGGGVTPAWERAKNAASAAYYDACDHLELQGIYENDDLPDFPTMGVTTIEDWHALTDAYQAVRTKYPLAPGTARPVHDSIPF